MTNKKLGKLNVKFQVDIEWANWYLHAKTLGIELNHGSVQRAKRSIERLDKISKTYHL